MAINGILKLIQKLLSFEDDYKPNSFVLSEQKPDDGPMPAFDSNLQQPEMPQNLEKQSSVKKSPIKTDEWNKSKKDKKGGNQEAKLPTESFSSDINQNLMIIKEQFYVIKNQDLAIREFKIAQKTSAFIAYISGMADKTIISDYILKQLMNSKLFEEYTEDKNLVKYVSENVIIANQVQEMVVLEKVTLEVTSGMTALFIDGYKSALIIETKGFEKRAVSQPTTEAVIRGSQEGFTENLQTNITLIRRIIRNQALLTERITIGRESNTQIAVLYMNNITNPTLVNEVKRRISNIDTDYIGGSGILEQFIEDHPFMLVEQVLTTERPDRTSRFILEGHVAVITEGTPFALIMPVTFFTLMKSSEDPFLRWQFATFIRLIRYLALFFAALLPGMYVAITNYHLEMIPTDLLISIASARESVPFPTIVEVMLMELSFELIREAGIRVPGLVGTTLGIIGALILGQAAVSANIVSPILIIIVALTGLGSFAIPSYTFGFGVRIIRFYFIFLGSILGFFGITIGLFTVLSMMASMKSFGVPFLSPIGPRMQKGGDVILMQPVWRQEIRDDYLQTINKRKEPIISRKWTSKKKN